MTNVSQTRGDFGDERLSARHEKVQELARRYRGLGFPRWAKTASELEAIYRFTSNEAVTVGALLEPTFRKTRQAAAGKEVLVLHDTTQFQFGGDVEREGLGPRGKSKKADGFFGHFALAASATQHATCVGLLGFHHYVQAGKKAKEPATATPKSDKWLQLIEQCEAGALDSTTLLHVADREADDYSLFDALTQAGHKFIFRIKDRQLAEKTPVWLREKLEGVEHSVEREVTLSQRSANRSPVNRKAHAARATRKASLCIRALAVDIQRPKSLTDVAPSLRLNAVQVFEPQPPEGETAIEWLLLTTQPIDSPSAIERVVDNYRARWLIEEFFKALKTGCNYESRQLESLHALLNALGFLAPVAVELLQLREAARDCSAPLASVISDLRLAVLRAISHQPLPPQPSASDVCLAIARLGGHLKNNGFPGWLVLHRGFQTLLDAELGWLAAQLLVPKM